MDTQGRDSKKRPVVIVTATSEIPHASQLTVVGITGEFSSPLEQDEVDLPWRADGKGLTKLTKECVAKCSWIRQIKKSDILEEKGIVPLPLMEEIIKRLSQD